MNTIIYVHKGNSYYLHLSISQAKKYNPDCEILLFGDESNKDVPNATHYEIKQYMGLANKFDEVFFNNSPNRRSYELFCFQRWFIIKEFMMKNPQYNTDFVYCDSDTLLFSDVTNDLKHLSPNLMATESWESPAFTFFKKDVLSDFCDMIMWLYTTKEGLDTIIYYINKFEREATGQSISDMTAFMHYTTVFRSSKCLDAQLPTLSWDKAISESTTLFCYDHNINIDNGFETDRWGRKNIRFCKGKPIGILKKDGSPVQFKGLHFQGDAKYMMIRAQSTSPMSFSLFKKYVSGYLVYRIKVFIRHLFKTLGLSLRKI